MDHPTHLGLAVERELLIRIDADLARLEGLLPDMAPSTDDHDPFDPPLAPWPPWITGTLDDLRALRAHDPLGAILRLGCLQDVMCRIDFETLGKEEASVFEYISSSDELHASFLLALLTDQTEETVDRLVMAVTDQRLMIDQLPLDVLTALDRPVREELFSQLLTTSSWRAALVDLLLAEPELAHVMAMLERHALDDEFSHHLAVPLFERLLSEGQVSSPFLSWFEQALGCWLPYASDQQLDQLRGWIEACEALDHPDLAQTMRRRAFDILLDPMLLQNWLDCLPSTERQAAEVQAHQQVIDDQRRGKALLCLLDWPDLPAAAKLVREQHAEMHDLHRKSMVRAAKKIEVSAPDAALLLFRQAACQEWNWVETMMGYKIELIEKCASLWDRYPDYRYESHNAFVARIEQKRGSRS